MKHLIPECEALKARLPQGFESTLVLPCLRRVQEERGYVADGDIDALAQYLGVPRVQIEEVLSFYTQFRRQPIGLRGAGSLLDRLRERLGIEPGQTTPDGRFTLSTVECLGSCGTAPVLVVNEVYHESMTPEKLDGLLAGLE